MKRPGKSSSQDQSEEGRVSDARRALLLVLIAQAELATTPPPAADVTPRTKAILAKLEEPVAMVFPKKVTLDEVLQHIQRATKKGPNDPGIPIHIDPLGLRRVGKRLNSTVTINEKSLPLKDALARVLAPLLTSSRTTC
jgi:hypothetical protein